MKSESRGCVARITLNGFLLLVATVVVILSGWDAAVQKLPGASSGITGLLFAIGQWLVAPIAIPAIIVILLFFCALLYISPLVLVRFKSQQELDQRIIFRGLWLFTTPHPKSGLPTVTNRLVEQARCGECMGAIVSTDSHYGQRINYLKCQNGHYVGGAISYSEYQKEIEKQLEAVQRKSEVERRQALNDDLNAGKITQAQFDAEMHKPNRNPLPAPPMVSPHDPPPPDTPQRFYDLLIWDFEQQYVRAALEKIKVTS